MREARQARAWLSRAVEPGLGATHAFIDEHGPVEAVRMIRAGTAPEPVLKRVGARSGEDRSERDLDRAARLGHRFVIPEDDEWPAARLSAMELATARGIVDIAPPQALWVRGAGRLDETIERAVAVVGARAATGYGETVAGELGYGLAESGWTVVSGGAYGIDGTAHRGALAAAGLTVAVVACGLDLAYPAGHDALFNKIAQSGLIVSEWPPGSIPQSHRFLIRNRLIAALSAGVVVVEAGARSGSQSTARRGRELGRPVMAVPGPVTGVTSVGCHILLRDHEARLVTNAGEVIEEVGAIGQLAPRPRGAEEPTDGLDPVCVRVLDAVPRSPASPERIAVDGGVTVNDVLRCLPALELLDLVEATATGWRVSPARRSRRRRPDPPP